MLGLDFCPNFMLGLDGLDYVCRWFALEGDISPGNMPYAVLKHANQRQTLTKPCKPSVNYKQTNTVCLDYVNQFFKMQTKVTRSEPDV